MNLISKKNIVEDLICFSHLRWDFVYQRPQHLMSRFANRSRVFFVEEPLFHNEEPGWRFTECEKNVLRCVPTLPYGMTASQQTATMQYLVTDLAERFGAFSCVEWFYTPMMLDWAIGLDPCVTVYDCMDELSKFRYAPSGIVDLERRLFERAHLVFTGGHSLYTAKKDQHLSVHEFPSSIDAAHFRQALFERDGMADHAKLPRPRIGYAGVIDERIDLDLLAAAADARPDWSFIMLGPVVKIDPDSLPRRGNIHYLGMKEYKELPRYFADWDVGMMPFALNESTEFISPTKTPEYLAAGLPVVSTAITDVIRPYGELGLVEIISDAEEFVTAAERVMQQDKIERLRSADLFLSERSWDRTCRQMYRLIEQALNGSEPVRPGNKISGPSAAVSLAA